MIDDLDGDLAGLGLRERAGDGGIQFIPRAFADVGLQSLLELLIGLVIAEEIRVGHKERFAVVVTNQSRKYLTYS